MRNIYKIIFILLSFGLQAQLQTAHWYFGQNAGLDFSSGSPVAVTDGQINTVEGSTTYSDNDGNLIFYTDGQTVYNRNHSIMVGGTGLMGHESSTQSAIIIPKPDSPDIYYIFTIWNSNGLRYNVVDMSQDGGNGAVIEKNTFLMSLTGMGGSEKLTAATIAGCSGYWVLTHFIGSFYAFSVTSAGVSLQPVISTIGIQSYFPIQGAGHIKLSPNGKKLAVAHRDFYNNVGGLGLYDFDNSSGTVSNEQLIYTPNQANKRRYYGVEFSPDNNVLYATCEADHTSGTKNLLEQYDLTNISIVNSRYIIDSWDGVVSGALQLGLNNKIYHVRWSEYLAVINDPNEVYNNGTGAHPDYVINGVYLAGRSSTHGLPPFITSLFYAGIMINGINNLGEYCKQELNFSYCHNGGEIDSILWDFGDGTTSSLENPVHTYEPGTYTLKLQLTIGGIPYTTEEIITIHPLPVAFDAELGKCLDFAGNAEFDLTESLPQISSESDVDITFHELESQAETGTNDLPTIYTTLTNTTLYIRIENENGCFVVRELNLIINELPAFTFENAEICINHSAELSVETESVNEVKWYDSLAGITPIFTGNPFTTPNLTVTTSYWVEVVSAEGCPSERQEIVVEIAESITPLFDLEEQYCVGNELIELPGLSENNISGTWNPSQIDTSQTGIQTFVFTPDEGQCADEFTLEIEVTDSIEPLFDLTSEYCQSTELIDLPTTSINGITGTWSPNQIDTSVAGIQNFTFTPDEHQCSEPVAFSVEIFETLIPEFDLTEEYCLGLIPQTLENVSDNGIPGTWFPAQIDTNTVGTTIYTFTPDGICGEDFILEITVLDEITPTFNIQTQYCLNSEEIILPTESDNGVTGTWIPAIINTNNLGTEIYTFTPDLECAQGIQITIEITEIITPEFDLIQNYCLGAPSQPLPTLSDNGIIGTWFPSQIDTNIQGTTTYTFTPNDGQCGEPYQLTVTVYPHPDMDLEEQLTICEGDSFIYSAPDGFDSYQWKNQNNQIISTTQEVTFTEEGIYTLTVEINGVPCDLSRSIEVRFSTPPTITEIKKTENSITIYATGGYPLEYSMNQVFWQSSPTFTNLQPGIFNVFVRDAKGCSTTAKQTGILGVPNFISPNGDGYNDTWELRGLEVYPNTRLQIFDRYGKIFVDRMIEGNFQWDGKYNNQPLPSGSYWYILILESGEKLSGSVNIRNY